MDTFHTLAEIAVAVAGFSSLAIIFRGQGSSWSSQEYVSLAFAMCWSIGSVFLALLPIVLGEFGVELATSARIGLYCIAFYMLSVGTLLTIVRRRIASAGGGRAGISLSLTALFSVIVIGALGSGAELFPGPSQGWFAGAIALLMAHATAELGLLVINVAQQSSR